MSENNAQTLQSYDANIDGYISGTPHETVEGVKTWMDTAIRMLPENPTILEVGAGFGRRTEYLAAQGFQATPTDASEGFVGAMQARGHADAYKLDLLTDEIPAGQDMILADAVLLHFDEAQTRDVLTKFRTSLNPGGILAASVKKGSGEETVTDKLGLPRFFHYWQEAELVQLLSETGFDVKFMSDDSTGRNNSEWLSVIATPTQN